VHCHVDFKIGFARVHDLRSVFFFSLSVVVDPLGPAKDVHQSKLLPPHGDFQLGLKYLSTCLVLMERWVSERQEL
jgi:hypothetical protein